MTTLVTGATGLVGHQTCLALLDRGEEVRALVRDLRPGPLNRLPVEQVRGSLASPTALDRAMRGCETVIHCAAVYSYAKDSPVDRVNVGGTRDVLGAAAAAGVRRVVVVSSSVTCGSSALPEVRTEEHRLGSEPVPAYFTSKVAQEDAAVEIAAGERRRGRDRLSHSGFGRTRPSVGAEQRHRAALSARPQPIDLSGWVQHRRR